MKTHVAALQAVSRLTLALFIAWAAMTGGRSATVANADDAKPRALFDGKSFAGWEGDTAKVWRIENGTIAAGSLDTAAPRNEFLTTTRRFENFDLRVKFKIVGDVAVNAGVQFRTERIPNHHEVSGYQADIGPEVYGHLYDESRRKRMLATPDKATVQAALQAVGADGWHTYRIRAEGDHIQIWLNGVRTVDYVEKEKDIARDGIIAVQIHGGMRAVVSYKDIEIVELPGSLKPAQAGKASATNLESAPRPGSSIERFATLGKPARSRKTEWRPRRSFGLEADDVVVFAGQTDTVRSRRDGTLEALLAAKFAAAKPRFRNMAWEGDTVFEQWRDIDFGSWGDQLRGVSASVVVAQFGQAEVLESWLEDVAHRAAQVRDSSLDGSDHLARFITAYEKLLDGFTPVTNRVVLIGPRPFEKPASPDMPDHRRLNKRVHEYSQAIRALADRRGLPFVDLATAIDDQPFGRLTQNGLHLTDDAQPRIAFEIARQLHVVDPKTATISPLSPLRTAIVRKNQLWFDNWRPMNWSFAFGDRTTQPFGKPGGGKPGLRVELEEFKPLIARADARIHELAGALTEKKTAALRDDGGSSVTNAQLSRAPRHTQDSADHSVAAELASFTTTDSFDVNLFASEADGVVKPLQMRWDDRGRLWVLCAPTYPHIEPGAEPRDYVLVCEDTDHDGKADKFHRFAEGLFIPMGIEFGAGGVYLCEATELVHLKDTDGDGRADSRTVVLSGFGTADSHQMINGIGWGPGGELWFTQGHHVYSHVETPWGISKLFKAGVWRYRPRTGRLQGFFNESTAGLNCQGVAYDEWGQIFHNSGAWSGGFYTVPGMVPTLRPVRYMSLAVPDRRNTGIEFIHSRHLPDELQGAVVWGGFMANTVQLHRLVDEGSGFTAKVLPDLLKSSRPDFRPVNVRVGPDGAIYVCDWYNAVIGHYQASYRDTARDRTHGRIWRITAKGRPLVVPPDFSRLTPRELLDQLRSPEGLTRYNAKRRLFDLPTEEAVAATDAWRAALDPRDPKFEQLLLEAIGIDEAHEVVRPDALQRLLDAADPRVRAYGTRVIGNWAEHLENPLALLRERIHDEHPRVRLEAIVACSQIARPQSIEVAAMAVDRPRDRYIDYALHQTVDALKPYWYPAMSRGELRFDGQLERLRFVLESDGTKDVAGLIRRLASEEKLPPDARDRLLALLVTVGAPDDLQFALSRAGRSRVVLEELATVADLHRKQPTGDLAAALKPLLADQAPELRALGVRLAGAWRIKPLAQEIRLVLAQTDAPEPVVSAALVSLAQLEGNAAEAEIARFALVSRPAAVQAAAVRAVSEFDIALAARLAAPLLAASRDESLSAQLLAPLLSQRQGTDALAKALNQQKLAADPAILAHRALSAAGRSDLALLSVLNEAVGARQVRLDYAPEFVRKLAAEVMTAGNASRGGEMFHSKLANCTACHKLSSKGGDLGPDLTIIGAGRSPELLIESVLWPNRQVREGYMSTKVLTDDGRLFVGYRLKESSDELHLRDTSTNQVRRIAKSSIEEIADAGSIMPAGLTAGMTREELRDLIRFLVEQGKNQSPKPRE